MTPEGSHAPEQFAIVTDVDRAFSPARTLKHGDTFAVFDVHGDIVPSARSEHGLYHKGTRFLSRFELLIEDRQPVLLSSTVSEDNAVFSADLTNPDIVASGRIVLPRGTLHLFRSRAIWDGTATDRVRIANHGLAPIEVSLEIRVDADFADIFEVRGSRRERRGRHLPGANGVEPSFRYLGLDDVERRTRVVSTSPAHHAREHALTYAVALAPHGTFELEVAILCEMQDGTRTPARFETALGALRDDPAARELQPCALVSSNHALNRWIGRSTADLRMMLTRTPHGLYPYAGIPWYSTPFGRDGIITAFELLSVAPDVARGVLGFLAETQATAFDDASDAQPGKILHEMRDGEMAALGEIPFGRYYGTADATPLFVALAHAYFERTGDLAFVDRLWPHLIAALAWMERDGDPDRDGFIEYERQSDAGLVQQGWKDSWDSVFHEDGSLARGPIAMCEIQAYAYAAWRGGAALAAARGETAGGERWHLKATRLQQAFEEAFWSEDLGTYVLALDGAKRPCRVRASNAGHCLFAGIASPKRARQVADTLLDETSFGGWGIRTVASGAVRYNPMSYHNGSVWPHDNALTAAGFARYGLMHHALRIADAMFDLSQVVDLHRLPELICGFHRRAGDAPTLYPVACAPQAWAAGAVFLLLQSCLGLTIDASSRRIAFARAKLPGEIDWLRIENLACGDASIDLLLTRHPHDVAITVLRRDGDLDIVTTK